MKTTDYTNLAKLDELFFSYKDVNDRYEASIVYNHNGTRVENENFGLKSCSSRLYSKWNKFAQEVLHMSITEIIQYHRKNQHTFRFKVRPNQYHFVTANHYEDAVSHYNKISNVL